MNVSYIFSDKQNYWRFTVCTLSFIYAEGLPFLHWASFTQKVYRLYIGLHLRRRFTVLTLGFSYAEGLPFLHWASFTQKIYRLYIGLQLRRRFTIFTLGFIYAKDCKRFTVFTLGCIYAEGLPFLHWASVLMRSSVPHILHRS